MRLKAIRVLADLVYPGLGKQRTWRYRAYIWLSAKALDMEER